MKLRLLLLSILGISPLLMTTACLPKATPSPDTVATAVAQAAADLLTRTAAASSPTPPPPTFTPTPSPTETPTATPTSSGPPKRPQTTIDYAPCWLGGPGAPWQSETMIAKGKGVELLGLGNVAGWYVIRDPYFHRPCWIQFANLKVFPGTDLSKYPVMTPGVPLAGQ
jgi:hypothetical protein